MSSIDAPAYPRSVKTVRRIPECGGDEPALLRFAFLSVRHGAHVVLVTRRVKRCLVAVDRNTISQFTSKSEQILARDHWGYESDSTLIFSLLSDAGSLPRPRNPGCASNRGWSLLPPRSRRTSELPRDRCRRRHPDRRLDDVTASAAPARRRAQPTMAWSFPPGW